MLSAQHVINMKIIREIPFFAPPPQVLKVPREFGPCNTHFTGSTCDVQFRATILKSHAGLDPGR